ncbi:MAG: SpoIID/LytB domain-containing protein [Patescibacteria group bacterium]
MNNVHAASRLGTKKLRQTVSALLTAFFVVGLFAPFCSAEAALHGYAAEAMIRTAERIELRPGEVREFTIGFKNVGSAAWSDGGNNFVSAYTYEPKYRASVFRDVSWYRNDQPAKISGTTAPGQIGYIRFKLKAPSTAGNYRETFHLAAENLAWIPGGQFYIDISVGQATATNVTPTVPVMPTSNTVVSSNDRTAYSAIEVSRSDSTVNMKPGEKKLFSIMFRNTGSATWLPDGKRFVSAYTYEPKYRNSVFADTSWYRPDQPARIASQFTPPGQLGEMKFYLKAPTATGTYSETFYLAAEDLTWIPGGMFTVRIVVDTNGGSAASSGSDTQVTVEPTPTVAADGYGAVKMLSTSERLQIRAGDIQDFRVAFKNSGVIPWVRYGNEPVTLLPASESADLFRNTYWDGDVVSGLGQDRADTGQLAFFNLKLKAPNANGLYTARFTLHAGDRPIEGGTVDIPIEVTGGSVSASVPQDSSSEFSNSGSRGPNIRVGLLKTTAPLTFFASGTYQLIDGENHAAVRQLSGTTSVVFDFSTLKYTVRNGSFIYQTDYHVHLQPDNPASTILEITSYESRPTWDTSLNFNKFRGDLSVHYMRSTGNLWVIEELPIEDYMRGLAETSNGSPTEYQRALVTAARTYALYVLSIGGKHKSEYHDVNTTAGDQVYKGYASELVRPNVVKAVEDTRGSVVTYNGELVVTPYFSRSDGRTRSWSEVWGGSKPWCVSVPAPYDQGETLWGHGVGMSASDALGRAQDGASWTEILRYYYTGTEVKKIY